MRGQFGEVNFPSDPERVVHWTPEQLGMARTVPDVPVRKTLTPDWSDAQPSGTMRLARVKRDRRPTMRTLGQTVQRAETPGKSEVMKTDGVKCAFDGCAHLAYGGRKYCTTGHGYKNKPAAKQTLKAEAQQPGTSAAPMDALANVGVVDDEVRVKIEIELTQSEINRVLDRLTAGQRLAFLNHGLRAALLA
jgi:hypothetical protein